MKTTKNVRAGREEGFALVAVLMIMLLIAGVTAAMHASVMSDTVSAGAHHRAASGFYSAEAGINRGMGDYRNIFLSYGTPTVADHALHTFMLGARQVDYQLTDVPGNPRQVIVPAGRPFAGINATEYRYTATSTSRVLPGDIEASIGTTFNVDYVPLFQFLAFYQNDLEILPGANMNLHGPVHTNGNLYINSDATLTVNELNPNIPTVHLSSAGRIYRGRKDVSTCAGTVNIARLRDANNDGALDIQAVGCSGSGTTQLSSSTLSGWLGAMLANQPAVSVPTPDALQHGSGDFWHQADLRIVLNVNGRDAAGRIPIVVQNDDGTTNAAQSTRLQTFMAARPGRIFYNDVPRAGGDQPGACVNANSYCNRVNYTPNFLTAAAVYPCGDSSIGLYAGCATRVTNELLADGTLTARRGGFYSNREAAWVQMLNVNVHDLLAWNRGTIAANRLFDPDDTTDGGVVLFFSVDGPGSAGVSNPRYGVRIFGSPNLDFPAAADPTGVTIVSDNAVFVEGDYNTGTGTCTSFAACPKSPSAIMGDTLNVLSNNWDNNSACGNDCQSRTALNSGSRVATSTAINAAFISGVDTTVAGAYNGGLENYPRFHEDWGGRTLTYRGSFVSLGTPRHNSGAWCGTGNACNIYNPPARNWDYDTDFQNVALLPPLTPRFVAVEQILFTENFR
ncbi:MAG TPA: PilX N-terminal domain-containing pilus assembly protein [Candidatus Eisenbacteria bacterium]|nr:PilX N-terminal domain-containing pilus assembly protein [Candidatus Eisenbacteria bacterium]